MESKQVLCACFFSFLFLPPSVFCKTSSRAAFVPRGEMQDADESLMESSRGCFGLASRVLAFTFVSILILTLLALILMVKKVKKKKTIARRKLSSRFVEFDQAERLFPCSWCCWLVNDAPFMPLALRYRVERVSHLSAIQFHYSWSGNAALAARYSRRTDGIKAATYLQTLCVGSVDNY